jgi:hypothetical protein
MLSASGNIVVMTNRGGLLHVELGTTGRSSSMERNHLCPKQVLPWGDTGRNIDGVYTLQYSESAVKEPKK